MQREGANACRSALRNYSDHAGRLAVQYLPAYRDHAQLHADGRFLCGSVFESCGAGTPERDLRLFFSSPGALPAGLHCGSGRAPELPFDPRCGRIHLCLYSGTRFWKILWGNVRRKDYAYAGYREKISRLNAASAFRRVAGVYRDHLRYAHLPAGACANCTGDDRCRRCYQ